MLRWIRGRLRCAVGTHERSPDLAIRVGGDHMTSRCVYCGVALWRVQKRHWVVDRGHSAEFKTLKEAQEKEA